MRFAPASGGPLTHDRSPTQKENGPYKQGIKPSTRVVYNTVTFKQRSLITGGCVYPGMLEQEGHIKPPVIQKESDVIQVYPYI